MHIVAEASPNWALVTPWAAGQAGFRAGAAHSYVRPDLDASPDSGPSHTWAPTSTRTRARTPDGP